MKNKLFINFIALLIFIMPISTIVLAAPTISDFTKSGSKNIDVAFTAADFIDNFTDDGDLVSIRFPELPSASEGVINLSDTAVEAGIDILAESLDDITFIPATDFTGTVEINWEATNGAEYSEPATISIAISSTAPTVADFTKNGTENIDVTFTASDFENHYTGSASLVSVRFPALPEESKGMLKLVDSDIAANAEITAENLSTIVFVPAADFTGTATVPWEASDGTEYSAPATISIVLAESEPDDEDDEDQVPTFEYLDMDGHWANAQALELAYKNILRGEQVGGNFYFEPERPVNRGDFVRFLNAALGITLSTPDDEDFDFVDKDTMPSWLYHQGKIAYEAGIISGVGKNNGVSFDPYAPLTRIEAIKMISNILDIVNTTTTTTLTFTDSADIPAWGLSAVQAMLAENVIQGFEDNTIRPNKSVLREDSVVMISNMLQVTPSAATTMHVFTEKIAE